MLNDLNQEPVNNQVSFINPTSPVTEPKKSGSLKTILLGLGALLVVGVSLTAYYLYTSNKMVILGKSISSLESLQDYFVTPVNLKETEEMTQNGVVKFETSESSNALNDFSFTYDFSHNKDTVLLGLGLNKDTDFLGGIELYSNADTGYIYSDELFDKYIEVAELKGLLSSTNSNEADDYKYLYNFVTKSFLNNIDTNEFKSGKVDIKIDGANKEVNYLTLEYTENDLIELAKKVANDIKKDTKANDIMLELYPEFETLTLNPVDSEHMSKYAYTVYTTTLTNKVVGVEIKYDYFEGTYNYDNCGVDDFDFDTCKEEEFEAMSTVIQYVKGAKTTINVIENDVDAGYIELIKKDNTVTANLYDGEELVGYITITSSSDLYELEYEFTNGSSKARLLLTSDIEEIKKGEEYKLDTVIQIDTYEDDKAEESVSITAISTIKASADIKTDFTNSVKMDDLTDADKGQIFSNAMTILTELGL